MRRPAPNTIKYTNCTCRILGRRNRHAGTTPSSATVRLLFTLVFTANAHIVIPNVMRRPALNTIKYTNFTCRTVGRRNRRAGMMLAPATSLSATSLSATHSFVALSSATVWGLSVLVFTANAHIVIPNVMRRLDPNTIKYTNCICRILGRRNRHAGTTPSSAVVRPPFTFRRSYRRRHRLVSFSSKSFRFGDVAALPIRSPRSVTDEYWYVASAARSGAAERRVGAAVQRGMRRGAGIDPLFFRTAGSSRETPSFGKPLRRLPRAGRSLRPRRPAAGVCSEASSRSASDKQRRSSTLSE